MKRKEIETFIEHISESVEDFKYIPKLITAVKEFEEEEDVNERNMRVLTDFIEDKLFKAAENSKGKHSKVFVELAIAMAEKKMSEYYRSLQYLFRGKGIANWKEYSKEAITIIETFKEPPAIKMTKRDESGYGKNKPEKYEMAERMKDCIEEMVKAFVRDKIAKKVGINLLELLINCIKEGSNVHLLVAHGILDDWDFSVEGTKAKTLIPELVTAIDKWTRDVDEKLSSDDWPIEEKVADKALTVAFKSSCPPNLYIKQVESIWSNTLTKELEGQPLTGWGQLASSILSDFIVSKATTIDMTEIIPGVIKLLKCDIETLKGLASGVIATMYQKIDALVPCADDVVDVFLEDDELDYIGMALKPLYAKCPDKILPKMDDILDKLADIDDGKKSYIYLLLDDVSKEKPELFIPHIETMMGDLDDPSIQFQVLMVLGEIASKYPEKFENHIDTILGVLDSQPIAVYHVDKIIASVGTVDKEKATKILKILADQLQTVQIVYISVVLMEMKRIGHKFPECLTVHRKEIEAMKDSPQMGVADMVVALVDFMEGRTLEALHEDIADQKEDIDQLDTRVTNTENNVAEVTEKVEQHDKDITEVKTDVANQGQKLEELEEVVDETVVKVDEIDHKTITNAPKWSRDVAKILNPEADYDWRFLAIRLGYSGEDIRNWALSPDPTMAILAEWYTTHKSSDATYAILTALEDMGQTEAVKIVEDSLEKADAMVPKAGPEISEKPPKVFISYQWDHQPEVKAIREHLEMAGFGCWMDIGQMGGGDNLYAKINEGMRAAKVVLCMTTEKYSKSENCNKEVNLANLLNKPIIPILIERTAWPPEGPMSMLFAQLLYIQFFTEQEYVRGEKFWPDSKFSELLAQVNYYAAPDPEKITEEYKNWVPTVEAPKKEVKHAAEKIPTAEVKTKESIQDQPEIEPEVFISYQWDHQPQIKSLYQRLTDLGYSCWLDIKQMGGGDPLYSKIDKGLRKAKVVISCVTPKYSLSANCRREVSLSDALRRPIIPILLQQMSWPPEGPMSMTFTQLLYIDFTKESSQKNFDDEKFYELIAKINEHSQPVEKQVEAADDTKSTQATPPPPENAAVPNQPEEKNEPEEKTEQQEKTEPDQETKPKPKVEPDQKVELEPTPEVNQTPEPPPAEQPNKEPPPQEINTDPTPANEPQKPKKSRACSVL